MPVWMPVLLAIDAKSAEESAEESAKEIAEVSSSLRTQEGCGLIKSIKQDCAVICWSGLRWFAVLVRGRSPWFAGVCTFLRKLNFSENLDTSQARHLDLGSPPAITRKFDFQARVLQPDSALRIGSFILW